MAFPVEDAIADEKGPARRKAKEGWNTKSRGDLSLRIRQELEGQPLLCFEFLQTVQGIPADAENLNIMLVQLVQPIAKTAGMRGTNGRAGSQIKVDEHRAAGVGLAQINHHAVLIDRLNNRRAITNMERRFITEEFEHNLYCLVARTFASSSCRWARSLTRIAPVAVMAAV